MVLVCRDWINNKETPNSLYLCEHSLQRYSEFGIHLFNTLFLCGLDHLKLALPRKVNGLSQDTSRFLRGMEAT